MKTLKVEAVYIAEYETFEDVATDLPNFIENVYATFETIRTTFLKIAARIEMLKTRIRVSSPTATPNTSVIAHMLNTIAARAP